MKSVFIAAIGSVVLLSSCSVYRSGQTPDDLYYASSPQVKGGGGEYVAGSSDRDDGRRVQQDRSYNGYDDFATMDDRWLMMRVRNRSRWSMFDNYSYFSPYNNFYNPYGFGFGGGGFQPGFSLGLGFGNPYSYNFYNPYSSNYYNHFNNYWNWNQNYNPYYGNIIVVNPKTNPIGYTKARNFNMGSYNNTRVNTQPARSGFINGRDRYNTTPGSNNTRRDNNSYRRVFSNSRVRGNDTYNAPSSQDRPARTYSPSINNSPRSSGGGNSGSSGSSGGNTGSRPSRR